MELAPGEYDWEGAIGEKLRYAKKSDYYAFVMIWVASPGSLTPEWLYGRGGVPKVLTYRGMNPLGKKEAVLDYPHYLHENYKKHYFRLIAEFGRYVDSLPDELHECIIFVQAAEGSTGDGEPYKGSPH